VVYVGSRSRIYSVRATTVSDGKHGVLDNNSLQHDFSDQSAGSKLRRMYRPGEPMASEGDA